MSVVLTRSPARSRNASAASSAATPPPAMRTRNGWEETVGESTTTSLPRPDAPPARAGPPCCCRKLLSPSDRYCIRGHDDHRAVGVLDQCGGTAPQQQRLQAGQPTRADHDCYRVQLASLLEDRGRNCAHDSAGE